METFIYPMVPTETAHYLYILFFVLGLCGVGAMFLLMKKHWAIRAVVVAWGCVMLWASAMVYSDAKAVFHLTATELKIVRPFGDKVFARDILKTDEARVIELSEEPEYGLWYKTMGTGMQGFNTGRFVLQNKQRAFVFLTQLSEPVVYIPTTERRVLLFSIQNPEEFIEALQQK